MIPINWSIRQQKLFNNQSHLISFEIPSTIKIFNDKEYEIKKFVNYVIPSRTTSLNKYLFINCEHLESIKFHSKITSIGKGCFYNCPKLKISKEEIVRESLEKQIWLNDTQAIQIEEWTKLSIGSIIFDSRRDNWKSPSFENEESLFKKKLFNKENLII